MRVVVEGLISKNNEMNLTKIGSCRVRICRFQIVEFLQKKSWFFKYLPFRTYCWTSIFIDFQGLCKKNNKSYWRVKPFSIEFQPFWTDLFKSQLGVSTEKRRRSLSNRSRCFRYENERDLKIRSKLQLFNGKKWGKEKNWQSSRKIIYEKWKWCLRRMKKNENSDCRNPQRINKNCERGEEKVECAIRI